MLNRSLVLTGLAVSLLLVEPLGPSFWKVLSLGEPTGSKQLLPFLLVEAVGAWASKAGLAGWLFVCDTPPLLLCAAVEANFPLCELASSGFKLGFASWRDPLLLLVRFTLCSWQPLAGFHLVRWSRWQLFVPLRFLIFGGGCTDYVDSFDLGFGLPTSIQL